MEEQLLLGHTAEAIKRSKVHDVRHEPITLIHSEPESRPNAQFELIHNPAAEYDDTADGAHHTLKIRVHDYRQVLRLEADSPMSFGEYLHARPNAKHEPRRTVLWSRHARCTQAGSDERPYHPGFFHNPLACEITQEAIYCHSGTKQRGSDRRGQ